MPAGVLLMAKLVTLAFVVQGNVTRLPAPFLPLVSAFEPLSFSDELKWALQVSFVVFALLLFGNVAVRASAFVLGAILLTAILSSRVYYENNKVYVAFILLLAGLSEAGKRPWVLQGQVALLYFGAGFNKALNPGWQSGEFLEQWSTIHAFGRVYDPIASLFPGMLLSAALCWLAIATEFVMAAFFLFRRTVGVAIWLGVAYHSALLAVTGRPFGMFWFAALASYLAFVEFPGEPVEDGRAVTRLHSMLRTPTTYFVFVALAALPQPESRWIAVVAFTVLGLLAYDARRRRPRHPVLPST